MKKYVFDIVLRSDHKGRSRKAEEIELSIVADTAAAAVRIVPGILSFLTTRRSPVASFEVVGLTRITECHVA